MRLPHLVEGIDLRALPIGPAEAFVLSRVDGATNVLEIAEAAGLDPLAVAATLSELTRLGAVRFDDPAPSPGESIRPMRPAARVSGSMRIGPIIEASGQVEPHHPAAALYDERELDEAVDLAQDRKRVILEAFHHLDNATHYQLLKVDPSADKRAIKAAYYEVVNVFHPDRYFGKNLGTFKPKIERVFARLTEAYDAVTRPGPRAEYDAYLASLKKTREFDTKQSDSTLQAQVQAIQRQIEEEAQAAERAHAALSGVSSERISTPIPGSNRNPLSGSQPRLNSVRPPLDPEARKRALARKLGGRNVSGSMPAPQIPTVTSLPPPTSVTARERAGEDLKRRYDQRVIQAREKQAERLLVNAHSSLANKDPLAAVNGLRIAATLVPDNPEISARLQEAQTEATILLADHYLTQAQYEEREGRLVDAARSYGRATLGSPLARTFERAAYCTLMAEGDLRVAGDYARKAVALVQAAQASGQTQTLAEEAQARVTLARIYVAAGMKQSGLAEFERAATLAPKDDTIRDWIRRLKRGEA
ncbi:MAG TPA: DnaJ domain-containing protein [Polyangiaceae bacterium]|jgi:curved DNA-binding protein CbpA|nr:DnaJ domain-containing protein [Polyangiaceae bacterium]